jgi:PKD repeat protein
LIVAFTDTSTGATTTSWSWDFGDGASSPQQNPTHAYTTPGSYSVSLTTFVGPSQTDTLVKNGFISVDPAPPGHVISVPGDFTSIQAAVDAAEPGQVVLIEPGSYSGGVVVQEGISVVGNGGTAVILGRLKVENVPIDQTFLARGLNTSATTALIDNDGHLRIEACSFKGENGSPGSFLTAEPAKNGSVGLLIQECGSVALIRCFVSGGFGADLNDEKFDLFATSGGSGAQIIASTVAAFDCRFSGAGGGSVFDTVPSGAGSGGSGVIDGGSTLHLSGCTVAGGDGGSGDCNFSQCGSGGGGGHGVSGSGTAVTLRANSYAPGLGGQGGDGAPAADGQAFGAGAVQFPGEYRNFWSDSPVFEGDAFNVYAQPVPGDVEIILTSLTPLHFPVDPYQGVLLISLPSFVSIALSGSGQLLTIPVVAPELPPEIGSVNIYLQAVVLDLSGQLLLGPPSVLTLIDDA